MRNTFFKIQAVVLLLLLGLLAACGKPKPLPSPVLVKAVGEDEPVRVVLAGHLYSLYTENRSEAQGPGILTDKWLKLFADEVDRLAPDRLFLLGDNTRFSTKEEWKLVRDSLATLVTPYSLVAGNHDLRDAAQFKANGGLGNKTFVIKNSKFIVLDNKCVFGAEDLAFLDQELKPVNGVDHIFVLMHYCMINWNDSQPGQDPREPYPGVSNWNRDVLPRLAGKVDYVFCGDHAPGGPARFVQEHNRHKVHYVMSSFVFRRGETNDTNGEGLNTFLEVVIDGEKVTILPRVLPIPVEDPWYRNFHVEKRWTLTSVGGAWAWLPPEWQSHGVDVDGTFLARHEDGSSLTMKKISGSIESWRKQKTDELLTKYKGLAPITLGTFKIWHQDARWELVQLVPGDRASIRFYCSFEHDRTIWSIEAKGPEKNIDKPGWPQAMVRVVAGMKLERK